MAASDHLDRLTAETERRLERLFASFDTAWRRGSRPRIVDFLPEGPPSERLSALHELVLIDLEYAIARDASPRIEAYLAEFPELASDRERVLELADREYRLRRGAGSSPSVKEYVARFPDLAARLVFRLEDGPMPPEGAPTDETRPHLAKPTGPPAEIVLNGGADASVPAALPEEGTPRYRHIRPHARGGLGEVFLAEDTVLNRRVALKRIRPEFADDPAVRRRFWREAEITARLEHPGIAPIHELITDRTGQSWYVMRFLKGHTLRSAIERYHRAKPGAEPAARSLELRSMLTRFVSVCETMSYVHKRGVTHRDLTPANVMLGDYGETIVLDWGFATATGEVEGPEISTSMAPAASPLDASLMKSGRLFGTPAFMAPEQAGMHQSAVGQATDIYCLGAILYMLLAGRPPFVERDLARTLEKVQVGEFPRPGSLRPETPSPLEAICLKAMSLRPVDRYSDAQDIGRDIECWLADEPVSAYREPVADRAGRWARRHRTRLRLVAAACVIAAIGGGIYGVATIRRRAAAERLVLARRDQAEHHAMETLRAVRKLAVQAKDDPSRWSETIAPIEDVIAELEVAGSTGAVVGEARALLQSCRESAEDQRFLRDLKEARLKGALRTDGTYDVRAKRDEYRRLFAEHGLDLEKLSASEASSRIAASRLRATLVATLDDWALELDKTNRAEWAQRQRLLALATEADPDALSIEIRAAIERDDATALTRLARSLDKRSAVATRLHTIGYALYKMGKLVEAEEFLSGARTVRSGDFWINSTLAQVYFDLDPPRLEKALARYESAVDLLPESAVARLYLGNTLVQMREIERAILVYQEALRLAPDCAEAHYALAYAWWAQGRLDDAAGEFRLAIRYRPDFPEAHNGYVRASLDAGHIDACRAEYASWIAREPRSAPAHCGYGLALANSPHHLESAIKEYRAAIALDPNFAPAHHLLGNAMYDQGRIDEALTAQKRAVELNPDSPLHQHGLGRVLAAARRPSEAEDALRRAIRRKRDFPEARSDLGLCLFALGRADEAADELTASRPLGLKRNELSAFLKGGPRPANVADPAALARLCHDLRRHAAAAEYWSEAFAGDRDNDSTVRRLQDGDYQSAARDAALASSGQGRDEPPLDEAAREHLRAMARRWLDAQQGLYAHVIRNVPDQGEAAADVLRSWTTDPDFACIRESPRLEPLPEAERKAWRSFWAEIDALISAAPRPR